MQEPNETKPLFCCEGSDIGSQRAGGAGLTGERLVQRANTALFFSEPAERNKITEVLLRWAGNRGWAARGFVRCGGRVRRRGDRPKRRTFMCARGSDIKEFQGGFTIFGL